MAIRSERFDTKALTALARAEVEALAEAPLPPDPGTYPRGTATAAAPATDEQASELASVVVPPAIIRAIHKHAESVEPGMEVVGRIVIDLDREVAIDYVPLVNIAEGPGRAAVSASWRREPGHVSVVVHSHPRSPQPSAADLRYRWPGLEANGRLIAVYQVAPRRLGLYRIAPDRLSFAGVPVHVQPRGAYRVDHKRREVRDADGGLVAGGYDLWREWQRQSISGLASEKQGRYS